MWDKSIPKRALKLSLAVSLAIGIVIALKAMMGGVEGHASEVAARVLMASVAIPLVLWLFFIAYLIFNPDFDGYEKHQESKHDGNS